MPKTIAPPRLIGATALFLLALLSCALLPAAASAAPEGEAPTLEVSPPGGEFEKTTAGFQSPAREFTLSNPGPEPVWIENAYIEGADSGQFYVQSSNCGGSWEGCSLRIVFSPSSTGVKTADVRIQADGFAEQTFPISGEAVAPQLSLEPAVTDFGTQWVYRGTERTVRVRNSGEARLGISGINVGGPDTHAFWNGNSDCWSLPEGWLEPGASCDVSVYFQPDDVRDFEASLRVSVNGTSFDAVLRGSGGRAVIEPEVNRSSSVASPPGRAARRRRSR